MSTSRVLNQRTLLRILSSRRFLSSSSQKSSFLLPSTSSSSFSTYALYSRSSSRHYIKTTSTSRRFSSKAEEDKEDFDEDEEDEDDEIEETSEGGYGKWIILALIAGGMFYPIQDVEAFEDDATIPLGVAIKRNIAGWFEKDDTLLAPAQNPDSFGRIPRTLVMNLDGTIGHPEWSRESGWCVRKRPYLDELFQRAFHASYEFAIWETNSQHTSEQHLIDLDHLQLCRIRLFREHCNSRGMKAVKDLTRLGRDMERVVAIDYDDSVVEPKENCIKVSHFTDDQTDKELHRVYIYIYIDYIPTYY